MNKYIRKVILYLRLKEKREIMYKEQFTICRKYKFYKSIDDLEDSLNELYAYEFFQAKLKGDKHFEIMLSLPKKTVKNNLLTNILKYEKQKRKEI